MPLLLPAPEAAHVWRCDLDAPERTHDAPEHWLAADEARRAARLRRETDRRRFVAARAALRGVLAGYLHRAPSELRFVYGPNGKPMLAPSAGPAAELHFNLSHSAGCALIAVAWQRALGIDVERVRPMRNLRALTERVFSPAERAAWLRLPPQEQLVAFFACWTRKEAWVKAQGGGIFQAPRQFTVSVDPAERAPELCDAAGAVIRPTRWTLRTLQPAPGFVGALAVQGPLQSLRQWTWPPPPDTPSGEPLRTDGI